MEGDGTKTSPWLTLEEVWNSGKIQTQAWIPPYKSSTKALTPKNIGAPIQPGDTIHLLSGHHGKLIIIGAINNDWITVKAADGAKPTFGRIMLRSSSKWVFDGISISPSHVAPYKKNILFLVEDHSWSGPSSFITIRNSTLFGMANISGWNAQNWIAFAPDAIHTEAENTIIENMNIFNVHNGVTIEKADYTEIKNSTINHISGDGIQNNQSSYVKIEYNTIKNIYTVDKTHKDMIQAWTFDAPITGMEIRGNTLVMAENDKNPLTLKVQGIGMFDGWYDNTLVENNLIVTNTDHGISFYGAKNCRIINNTVTSVLNSSVGPTGAPIRIYPHKNGTPGFDNIIRNNLATYISTTNRGVDGGVLVDHNIKVINSDHFINAEAFDFRLKKTSPAIDTGSIIFSPEIDILKNPRTNIPDIGAYEYIK
ncbi:right-handed parallel beta-helix repeat-containing protein [Desulfocapsa sulfexigens]|uniref:right-handed parallel beta-helix repeat-containing protein n=1 Tax=Desulfocapsa sulfexigens TaxID=65555 RepID=UPI001427B943|nr:right-handed parallel beta-helix repeat-containing protein [Desulfocapsa sulfexigens]